jgi:hypothetical protein
MYDAVKAYDDERVKTDELSLVSHHILPSAGFTGADDPTCKVLLAVIL